MGPLSPHIQKAEFPISLLMMICKERGVYNDEYFDGLFTLMAMWSSQAQRKVTSGRRGASSSLVAINGDGITLKHCIDV